MRAEIRPATAADRPGIAAVRRASWFAAYDGIIDDEIIDRVTTVSGDATDPPPYRRTLVAVSTAVPEASPGAVPAAARVVVGYAAFGPERTVPSAIPPPLAPAGVPGGPASGRLTPAGLAGETGELYALYLTPAWWSTGTGRALLETALAALTGARYQHAVLWTLTGNARARRFYEKAGFAPDGTTNILTGLGGVEELRYTRDL